MSAFQTLSRAEVLRIQERLLEAASSGLPETQKRSLISHVSSIPSNFRGKYINAICKQRFAGNWLIAAKCHECVGYEKVISSVRFCKSWKCPLWRYRPYQQDPASNALTSSHDD